MLPQQSLGFLKMAYQHPGCNGALDLGQVRSEAAAECIEVGQCNQASSNLAGENRDYLQC